MLGSANANLDDEFWDEMIKEVDENGDGQVRRCANIWFLP
jgi:Ca2+-binding EF-hand superfamily protein